MGEKVLLVDDDEELGEMLRDYLERDGFKVTIAHDGETGAREATSGKYAIVVLDVMLPGASGIDVLRHVRRDSTTPVLMLTARGDDTDRIVGLELGADDYVPKPCSARELAARIRAILKRTRSSGEALSRAIRVGPLAMWPERRKVEWAGNPVELTSTEFGLLEVLVRHAGQIVSKQNLSEEALGRPLAHFDRSIDMHMCNIRQKLALYANGRSCIQTVIRKGYMLVRE